MQLDRCQQHVQQKCVTRADFENELAQKADILEVSNAITEVVASSDVRKELEAVKTKLAQLKYAVEMDSNKHVKSMFDGFKVET